LKTSKFSQRSLKRSNPDLQWFQT